MKTSLHESVSTQPEAFALAPIALVRAHSDRPQPPRIFQPLPGATLLCLLVLWALVIGAAAWPAPPPATANEAGPPDAASAATDPLLAASTPAASAEAPDAGGDELSAAVNGTWCERAALMARQETAAEAVHGRDAPLNVSVSHALFRTAPGLVHGVAYQVSVARTAAEAADAVAEFSLLSLVGERPCGQFVSRLQVEPCPGEDWAVAGRLARGASAAFNWSVDAASLPECGNASTVTFRLRFRAAVDQPVKEMRVVLPLMNECLLHLWPTSANVSWQQLPARRSDCRLRFPAGQGLRRGLLVELTRLNVPCASGGFLRFSSSSGASASGAGGGPRLQPLCGKLEELPASSRRLHFPAPPAPASAPALSILLHDSPSFAFSYRLVDYCFNVTWTQQNNSLTLQPSAGLHCSFKIHLPYGNRVQLRLETLGAGGGGGAGGEGDGGAALPQLAPGDPDPPCAGLLVRLWDGAASSRFGCSATHRLPRNITALSRGNTVTLRVVVGEAAGEAGAGALRLWYRAEPVQEVVQSCVFGWVAARDACLGVVDARRASWADAEAECAARGGHLASIRSEEEQALVDTMLLNSPGYRDENAYWIGASDAMYEGDFRWSDGFPFRYTNWFPGWEQHKFYAQQPNDDGTSQLDCVELRRVFQLPSAGTRLTHSFMWNDVHCQTRNYFLCEHSKTGESADISKPADCNRSVTLIREAPRATVVSPGFPHRYPDNVECVTEVSAPPGYHLIIDFEELVLEDETDCSYDFLEISEVSEQPGKPPSVPPTKLCGDWSSRLKLQRYKSRGPKLRLRFLSDYSHHFGGFKARVSMENAEARKQGAAMECADDRFEMFNNSCYLFVGYPEVTWQTAQQTCRDKKAELASVHSAEEQNFITTNIRKSSESSTSAIYWLGGILQSPPHAMEVLGRGGQHATATAIATFDPPVYWSWTDGSPMIFSAWLPGELQRLGSNGGEGAETERCLAMQWFSAPLPLLSSGFYWRPQRCSAVGGYVCKLVHQISGDIMSLNRTINGTEGSITSQNYPGNYNHNLDYWVQLVGPERTRLVMQFSVIDLEDQQDCLYDFVELSSGVLFNEASAPGGRNWRDDSTAMASEKVRWCGSHQYDMDRYVFVSAGNEVTLRFHSDYSLSGSGFAASWKAVDVSGCPQLTLTAREGEITSPNYPDFLMAHLDCNTTILAPPGRQVWLEFTDFDVEQGGGEWPSRGEGAGTSAAAQAVLEVDLGDGAAAFRPFQAAEHIADGTFLSAGERLRVHLRTGDRPRGAGFRAIYRTVKHEREEQVLDLQNVTLGTLLHLNYPAAAPPNLDFVQHLRAPPGHVILLELHRVAVSAVGGGGSGGGGACADRSAGLIEISDTYADVNGTWWFLCEVPPPPPSLSAPSAAQEPPPIAIASYFNTLHVRQRSGKHGVRLNATVRVQPDVNYKLKLLRGSEDASVESCRPNPCQNGGKCVAAVAATAAAVAGAAGGGAPGGGRRNVCQCTGHFTGMFCALTLCEQEPCLFGTCQLTPTGYRCNCQPGYTGANCEQKQRPCAENPCEGRGECIERSDSFFCVCHAWMEGPRCEKRMLNIPFKPLSERMLQEPFWLGLITVTVVLAFIGLVWCAKRHLPEKLEKLLAEEADRNRPSGFSHSRPPSVREQLGAGGAAAMAVGPSPQTGCPRSILGRLGIRKPSLLSLTSPHAGCHHPATATARTFSLDDLLKPPPRRTPSPRKKRNNSTPTKKSIAEKNQILKQLVTPSANPQRSRKMSLGELIQLSERKLKENAGGEPAEGADRETAFTDAASGSRPPTISLTPRSSLDGKLEKKVTFARLLSKVSAEMSSGSEAETGLTRHAQLSGLPRSASTPPSPAADQRSPHSTRARVFLSSNQGSDSMSSLEVTSAAAAVSELLAARRPGRVLQSRPAKNPSADSILFMFRNYSNTASLDMHRLSPSTTPTASSPQSGEGLWCWRAQDDVAASDESSASSAPTPMSSSCSLTMDSPPPGLHGLRGHGAGAASAAGASSTIEVPVLDALTAHKSVPASGALSHPPTILLEVPSAGSGGGFLSPIREVPTPLATPLPSPALTPVMARSSVMQQMAAVMAREADAAKAGSYPRAVSPTPGPPSPAALRLALPAIMVTADQDSDSEPGASSPAASPVPARARHSRPVPTLRRQEAHAPPAAADSEDSVTSPPASAATPPYADAASDDPSDTPFTFRFQVRPPSPRGRLPPSSTSVDKPSFCSRDGDGSGRSDCPGGSGGNCGSPRRHSQPVVVPLLTVQEPSPTHTPTQPFLGSPPPQRAGCGSDQGQCGESLSLGFGGGGCKGARRLLKELDKPNSLDLPGAPPLITVTCNMSEADSDTDSPAAKAAASHDGGRGAAGVTMCYLSPFSMCSRADRTASESNLSSSGYSSMASPGPSRCGSNNPLCPSEAEDPPGTSGAGPPGTTSLSAQMQAPRRPSPLVRTSSGSGVGRVEGEGRRPPEPLTLQGGRGRSDSETLSDDMFVESNDEGISTDHLDEKIEEGELKSAKELEVFISKELLENGKSLLELPQVPSVAGVKSAEADIGKTLMAPGKNSLQLPAIVVQADVCGGAEKHLSPVSSRSESPLSDKTGGLGRFSPMFYGHHRCDHLPFTDSDGLYDCPSSDCPVNRTTQATAAPPQHRKSTGRRRERRATATAARLPSTVAPAGCSASAKSTSPTKPVSLLLDVPGKDAGGAPTRALHSRKPSPKRLRARAQPPISSSSSSSSESINSTRELSMREKPDHICWPDHHEEEWGCEVQRRRLSVEASGEDTGEDAASHMLPKPMRDDLPKMHRKISRLRTISHQIRFLRRIEQSLKRREQLISLSDSCDDDDDGCGHSPPLSPIYPSEMTQQDGLKSNSASHLHQPLVKGTRPSQKHQTMRQKHSGELLIPFEDQQQRPVVTVTGSNKQKD